MEILILNGPNMNLLGRRERSIYGNMSFDTYYEILQGQYPNVKLTYFQSNTEGALIDKLHEVGFSADGILFNPGGYAHTSIALADAVAAITTPVIEVHISNVFAREPFRHHSYISRNCAGIICGFGLEGYRLGIEHFLRRREAK
ncbi:MAG: type II 3-dehydroquinate dehydratase [Cytophagales bacterium]|jgi:3-dehydroquinate dehydratase-2|nr:type II 3-dehydroquinate dehydratase [Cytophagales bacterium]